MAKMSKRAKMIAEKVEATKAYSFEEAANLLKEVSSVKFKGICRSCCQLGCGSS